MSSWAEKTFSEEMDLRKSACDEMLENLSGYTSLNVDFDLRVDINYGTKELDISIDSCTEFSLTADQLRQILSVLEA